LFSLPMDGQPWPGYAAHVLEHFLALGRLNVLRFAERVEVLAAQHGQRAQLQVLQQIGFVGAIFLSGWAGYVSVRAIWELTAFLLSLTLRCWCHGCRLLLDAMPWLLVLGAVVYLRCLLESAHLRQEWLDFLQQWGWSRQLLSIFGCVGTSGGSVDCPICAETLDDNPWSMVRLPCCKRTLCWACLRRHAESVIDDARPDMNCPLVCKVPVPDVLVEKAFRRHQWSWQGLDPLGRKTNRKRKAYERWCLTSGLASSCAARMEDVVHCPGSECNHMWLLPKHLRRSKALQEPGSRWDPRSWSLGRHMGFYTAPMASTGGEDMRCVHCPSCESDYCLLCSQPWEAFGHHHNGKSCLEFDATLPSTLRSKERHWAGAKACPGCGVRTLRSMGCNHMTCTQCAMHWCWVCGRPWQPWHYGCTANNSQGLGSAECSLM